MKTYLILILLALTAFFTSCSKDNPAPEPILTVLITSPGEAVLRSGGKGRTIIKGQEAKFMEVGPEISIFNPGLTVITVIIRKGRTPYRVLVQPGSTFTSQLSNTKLNFYK